MPRTRSAAAVDDEAVCSICLEAMSDSAAVDLPCGHALHAQCAVDFFRRGDPRCPLCRDDPHHTHLVWEDMEDHPEGADDPEGGAADAEGVPRVGAALELEDMFNSWEQDEEAGAAEAEAPELFLPLPLIPLPPIAPPGEVDDLGRMVREATEEGDRATHEQSERFRTALRTAMRNRDDRQTQRMKKRLRKAQANLAAATREMHANRRAGYRLVEACQRMQAEVRARKDDLAGRYGCTRLPTTERAYLPY